MSPNSTIDWAATGGMIGGLAGAVTALVALFALLAAIKQIRDMNRLNAEDSYLEFHRLSFDNPEFADPDLAEIQKDRRTFVQYHWFVVAMLIAIERIVKCIPHDATWQAAVEDDLANHKDYLLSDDFAPTLPNFSDELQACVNEFRVKRGASRVMGRSAAKSDKSAPPVTNNTSKSTAGSAAGQKVKVNA